jgi:hypothetical protein
MAGAMAEGSRAMTGEAGGMADDADAHGRPLAYRGFRSFDHLEVGRDYRPFALASETDRVPPFVVDVSEAEEARTWRLLATYPAISLHDHL